MSMVTSLQRTVALSLCFAIVLPSVAAQKKTLKPHSPPTNCRSRNARSSTSTCTSAFARKGWSTRT